MVECYSTHIFGRELRLENVWRLVFPKFSFCWRLVVVNCSPPRRCWITFKLPNSYGGWFTKLLNNRQYFPLLLWGELHCNTRNGKISPPQRIDPHQLEKKQKTRWYVNTPSVKRNSPKLSGQFLSFSLLLTWRGITPANPQKTRHPAFAHLTAGCHDARLTHLSCYPLVRLFGVGRTQIRVDLEVEGVGSNGVGSLYLQHKGPQKRSVILKRGVLLIPLKVGWNFTQWNPFILKNHFANEDKLEEKGQHFDAIYQERCFFFVLF